MKALIGHTGFVGSNLIESTEFDYQFNSKNINEITNNSHDVIVCAGLPSLKWYANKHPKEDLENINKLIECLADVKCENFVLISTIDVYEETFDNQSHVKCGENHHSYGRNRYHAEIELKKIFGDKLVILRLPAVFGNNLKKNVLYDLMNNELYGRLNLCDEYQWYDVRELWKDIDFVLKDKFKFFVELNLFSEPIVLKEIVDKFFPNIDSSKLYYDCDDAIKYDLTTNYFINNYWYCKNTVFRKMKNYLHE